MVASRRIAIKYLAERLIPLP